MTQLALLVTLITGNTLADIVSCNGKQGYAAFASGSSCFEFNSNAQTWVGSRDSCHGKGGRLAKVSSADLQSWLSARASEQFPSTDVWIGLSDRASPNAFMWDEYDGGRMETGRYYNWNSGQPWHGFNNDMNCVQMLATSGYTWRLYSCDWVFIRICPSICEYSLESSQPVSPEVKTTVKTIEIRLTKNTAIKPSDTASSTPSATSSHTTLTSALSLTPEAPTLSPTQTVTSSALSIWLPIVIVVAIVVVVNALAVMLVRRRRRISAQGSRIPFGRVVIKSTTSTHSTSSTQQPNNQHAISIIARHDENIYTTLEDAEDERQYDYVFP